MKRKLAFALLSVASVGVATSCFTWGQDPFGPARATQSRVATSPYTVNTLDGAVVTYAVDSAANENLRTDQAVEKLVKELKSADGAQRESLVAKLSSAVSEQFDRRQEGKAKELKELEEQLAKLKEVHQKRTQQRDRIVGDRVKQILNEVDGLGWGTETSDGSVQLRYPGGVISPSVSRAFGRNVLGTTNEPVPATVSTSSPAIAVPASLVPVVPPVPPLTVPPR